MEAIALRKKSEELERRIQELVNEFINDVGECTIQIESHFHFVESHIGLKQLSDTDIKVKITV